MDPRLPQTLQAALQPLLQDKSRKGLAVHAGAMSDGYRQGAPSRATIRDDDAVLAYALARLPATYAASFAVFSRLAAECPDFAPESLLDVGVGPGGAAWAARAVWPSLSAVTMVDHNSAFLALAELLAKASGDAALAAARFERAEIGAFKPSMAADLVIASYVLTELRDPVEAASRLFAAAAKMFVVIEPGRPREYGRMMDVRRALARRAAILAPCPHAEACPLIGDDWCHFSVRLPRSRDHMRLKGASVPFEDERYAYLALAPADTPLRRAPFSRVLAPPATNKHSIAAKLCAPDGLRAAVTQSRDKAAFKAMTKVEWGDALEAAPAHPLT